MLLVVDFSDLELADYEQTDVMIETSEDFTVGRLLDKLSEGIEKLSGIKIEDKHDLIMMSSDEEIWKATQKVKNLPLNDWDTVYISRR